MVHLRLNEKETNPNPHINFITALKADADDEESARQLLRALAAQVRPVMKAHGFAVNSFEEYEYNSVFAGRNWNNGETVELVLRRPDGSFYPTYWLMSTLCHELAHIKHMNHGPAFQALWSRLRAEVRQLQDRGYYGDGYWSSGQRLRDSARVGEDGINPGDIPEYLCGGAQSRTKPTARRRRQTTRGKRREVVPSLHTGAQTAKKRKSGARVTSKYAFTGEGTSLGNEGVGTGFRKQAASKRAREERALAAERRLLALQTAASGTSTKSAEEELADDDDSDDEVEFVPETDAERRQAIKEADEDSNNLKLGPGFSWTQFKDDFNFNAASKPSGSKLPFPDIIDISSDDEDTGRACDVPVASGSTFTSGSLRGDSKSNKGKGRAEMGLNNLVQSEIKLRKQESLGMAPVKGGGRKVGGSKSGPQKSGGRFEQERKPPEEVVSIAEKMRQITLPVVRVPRLVMKYGGIAVIRAEQV
ncbi:DNA-dependent metalloprotease WSS1-like protein [Psilocybe cubensis]|uniref:DNA-dependent metalloprotease WSS1-like protein n=1 Tax=Psilocybe cubensis TaxID=181762 RepID=A0ACB8H2F9_PSICU|nr:DNA-dependent metalloprotease WSS1-like protein [Psilocybe cubensis]KAH9481414.1 DNA-dependent metalloprotease WSS1-like protein [Psilocybe cubensis]